MYIYKLGFKLVLHMRNSQGKGIFYKLVLKINLVEIWFHQQFPPSSEIHQMLDEMKDFNSIMKYLRKTHSASEDF